jgi:hypothetical protein
MARLVARFFGLLFLLAGMSVGLVDGTRSIATDTLDWTSFGGALNWLFPDRMSAVQEIVTKTVHPFLWDPIIATFLALPAIALLFGAGLAFLIIARAKAQD